MSPLAQADIPRIILPLAQVERRTILRAMIVAGHNKQKAARSLDIALSTLQRKLAQYNYPNCLNF